MFRGFHPRSSGSIVSGHMVRHDIMAEGCRWSRVTHLIMARKQRKREREEETGYKIYPLRVHPSDLLPPTEPHFLTT
jgi:hypothetical protein